MIQLMMAGKYNITDKMKEKLTSFYGGTADEEETSATIRKVFEDSHYLIDTHTAVGAAVYFGYRDDTKDDTPTVIVSTASPYKFTKSVLDAISPGDVSDDDFAMADRLSEISGVKIPEAVESIRNAEERHKTICSVDKMTDTVMEYLGK